MKFKYLLLVITLVIGYYCRSFLPMMFFGDEGIEVEFNVPANLVPSAGGDYESSACQTITFSDGSWINSRRGHDFKMEKISETKYHTKINYRDYSPCSWEIRSLGWTLEYKDATKLIKGITGGGGGGGTSIHIADSYQLDKETLRSPLYHDENVFIINRVLTPKVYTDRFDKNEIFISIENEDAYARNDVYFNPYKHRETAKIIYNVTVDESKVRGLTVEQVLANQKKERAESQKP